MNNKLLVFLLTVFLVVGGVSFGTVNAQETYNWRMQAYTGSGTYFYEVAEMWADMVEEVSDGRIQINLYSPGAITPANEVLSAIENRTLDVAHSYSGLWIGESKAAPLFCSIPGNFDILDMSMWMFEYGGLELFQEMYDNITDGNVKVLPGGALSMETFLWSNDPIRTVEDLKGKQLRFMPLFGDVLKEHGMSVMFLPGGEVVPALERGVLDAGEFSIPALDVTFGFQDVAQYYHYPGIHQPSAAQEILINEEAWNELPEELQNKIQLVSRAHWSKSWFLGERKNIEAIEELEKAGAERVVMEEETVKTLVEWSNDWLDSYAAQEGNEFFAKVRKSQKDFMRQWAPYKRDTMGALPAPDWAYEEDEE